MLIWFTLTFKQYLALFCSGIPGVLWNTPVLRLLSLCRVHTAKCTNMRIPFLGLVHCVLPAVILYTLINGTERGCLQTQNLNVNTPNHVLS